MESTDGTEIEFKKGANTASITYDGNNINIENLNLVYSSGITLPQGQSISYDGLKDWRLVEVDDFESGIEGWKNYMTLGVSEAFNTAPILLTFSGANKTQSGNALAPFNFLGGGAFQRVGYMVLKKLIDLTGIPHTQVKIKCTIYVTGTPEGENVFAAVAPAMNTTNAYEFLWARQYFSNDAIQGISTFNINMGSRTAGLSYAGEFIIPTNQNTFVFLVGSSMDQPADDEGFMIDNVEIWVK